MDVMTPGCFWFWFAALATVVLGVVALRLWRWLTTPHAIRGHGDRSGHWHDVTPGTPLGQMRDLTWRRTHGHE